MIIRINMMVLTLDIEYDEYCNLTYLRSIDIDSHDTSYNQLENSLFIELQTKFFTKSDRME